MKTQEGKPSDEAIVTSRRSEDAAHQVTVKGWACKHCKRFWGKDERMARYCCSETFPCECGGRRGKSWTHCDDCRKTKRVAKWQSREEVEWDGTFPVALWDDDKFFWDESDLIDYAIEDEDITGGVSDTAVAEGIRELWLVGCSPNNGRSFEMSEYLCDDLPEDGELDDAEINGVVGNWMEANAPFSWSADGPRLCVESVIQKLGLST